VKLFPWLKKIFSGRPESSPIPAPAIPILQGRRLRSRKSLLRGLRIQRRAQAKLMVMVKGSAMGNAITQYRARYRAEHGHNCTYRHAAEHIRIDFRNLSFT
jgi:dTDP-4-dehydrorhamnose 3,5-epimerase-like enzyme